MEEEGGDEMMSLTGEGEGDEWRGACMGKTREGSGEEKDIHIGHIV